MLDLTQDERQYLLDVLRAAHSDLLHEIHHSRTRRFEDALRQTVTLNESLTAKLSDEADVHVDPAQAGYALEVRPGAHR